MSGQFTDWYLIRRFLQLEYLLINELAMLMHDVVWIKRAFVAALAFSSLPCASPWQRNAGEATSNGYSLLMLAVAASDSERSRL